MPEETLEAVTKHRDQLKAECDRITPENRVLAQQVKELQKENGALQAQVASLTTERNDARSVVSEQQQTNGTLSKQLAESETRCAVSEKNAATMLNAVASSHKLIATAIAPILAALETIRAEHLK